jgi:dolichol-phosphate mannosyltransferase
MSERPILSVVVPVFNEEEVLDLLHQRLTQVLEGAVQRFELVFVDDGSRDRSWQKMKALAERDPHLVLVRLSRNFGHQVAVTAGVDATRGDGVVLIDADLQDPPEVIVQMLARWREGYDVVYGKRTQRRGEGLFKRITAKLFYRMIRGVSTVDIPLDTGDFRLMSRRVVEVLKQFQERNRFVRGMVAWIGYRSTAVEYERAERHAGETKYPLGKMVRFAADAIVSFSFAPLRLATGLGLIVSTASFAFAVYSIIAYIMNWGIVEGWASTIVAVIFLGGVQLVSLGIIGEYMGRTYEEAKRRPLYVADVHRRGEGEPERGVPLTR